MKRIRYSVAASLDGFIAGPHGEYDWIVMDPDFDWAALYGQFDAVLAGRRTYGVMAERGMSPTGMGMRGFVVSSTLRQEEHPKVTILNGDVTAQVEALKAGPGKDIWLCGGSVLFRTLLDAGLVDAVDVTVVPVLLGGGTPLVTAGARHRLKLAEFNHFKSGIVILKYEVQ